MVLRKPYAFFIKIFKPLHLFIAFLMLLLIRMENKILVFFNNQLSSLDSSNKININGVIDNKINIIVFFVIVFYLIVLGIMYSKKKPTLFYFVDLMCFIGIYIFNSYSFSTVRTMGETLVSIKNIKFSHDLIFIAIAIEIVSLIIVLIRGLGVNIKKFDFDSDITKIDIDEKDREEFEVSLNLDFASVKKNQRKKIRHLKYYYFEHRFIINVIVISVVLLISVLSTVIVIKSKKANIEGTVYNLKNFSFYVDKSYILNSNYRGEKITDKYLVVVRVNLKGYGGKIYNSDFKLKVDNLLYKPTNKYDEELTDLGIVYSGEELSYEYKDYLFVYEIDEQYINDSMRVTYKGLNQSINAKINPVKYNVDNPETVESKIEDSLEFKDSLSSISFKINSFEIKNKFLLEYDFCLDEGDCIKSKEYIIPNIDTDFDKCVLKLNISYNSDNDDFNSFFNLFKKYGEIMYKIGNDWKKQSSGFEELKSVKTNEKGIVYLGVNKEIKDAEQIKLIFNVRDVKYSYVLK